MKIDFSDSPASEGTTGAAGAAGAAGAVGVLSCATHSRFKIGLEGSTGPAAT